MIKHTHVHTDNCQENSVNARIKFSLPFKSCAYVGTWAIEASTTLPFLVFMPKVNLGSKMAESEVMDRKNWQFQDLPGSSNGAGASIRSVVSFEKSFRPK
jgi:hypothetical protein